jgi:hypothetical protein
MDAIAPEVLKIFAAKETRRLLLARLPIEEKVKILVRLQEMAAPLLRARGRNVHVWQLDDTRASC